jgi:hypothetical protein
VREHAHENACASMRTRMRARAFARGGWHIHRWCSRKTPVRPYAAVGYSEYSLTVGYSEYSQEGGGTLTIGALE